MPWCVRPSQQWPQRRALPSFIFSYFRGLSTSHRDSGQQLKKNICGIVYDHEQWSSSTEDEPLCEIIHRPEKEAFNLHKENRTTMLTLQNITIIGIYLYQDQNIVLHAEGNVQTVLIHLFT